MTRKMLTSVLAATMIVSVAPAIYAEGKIDIDIAKSIGESKTFVFGKKMGVKYTLDDKKIQREIANKIDSLKGDYLNSNNYVKTYDFVIKTEDYEVGMVEEPAYEDKYMFTIRSNKDHHRYNSYLTKTNIYGEVMGLLGSTEKVEPIFNGETVSGLESSNAIDTAVKVSQNSFGRSKNVVLVGKNSVSDALCSASLAGYLNAPILLTDNFELSEVVLAELERLHAKEIYTTSGESVITKKIRDDLKSRGYKIHDYSGTDRYETSNKIAKFINKQNKFILASGQDFNDIPSVSPYAYEKKLPIILTKREGLPKANYDLLNDKSNVLAIGGYETITKSVYGQLDAKKVKAERIAGADRFETSDLLVKKLYPKATSFMYETSNDVVKDIATSPLSVKLKKPIRIVENINLNRPVGEEDNIYFYDYEGEEVFNEDILKKANQLLASLNIKVTDPKLFETEEGNYKLEYNGKDYIIFTRSGELVDLESSGFGNAKSIDLLAKKLEEKGYKLAETDKKYFDGKHLYRFEKVLKDNLTNRYDFYVVVYNPKIEKIVNVTRGYNPIEYKTPTISSEQAEKLAKKYYKKNSKVVKTELGAYRHDEKVELAYIVTFEKGDTVMVSPYAEKVIGEDVVK